MRPETHTACSYIVLERIIQLFENYSKNQIQKDYIYNAHSIHQRVTQAVVGKITDPFLKKGLVEPLKTKISNMESLPLKIHCGGMKLDTKKGIIRPNFYLLLICLYKFTLYWLYILIKLLISIDYRNKNPKLGTLIYGVPESDLNANLGIDFQKYCRSSGIKIIDNAKNYFVQCIDGNKKNHNKNFFYTKSPLHSIFYENKISMQKSINFFLNHIKSLYFYYLLVLNIPISCLLWRDYCEYSLCATLNNEKKIEAIVITNSNWLQQFLWMSSLPNKNFRLYLSIYSLNISALIYKDEIVDGIHPGVKRLMVDKIWTWNTESQSILRKENIFLETENVGPILWRPHYQKEKLSRLNTQKMRLCIFDITPQSYNHLYKSGITKSYYCFDNAKKFIDDIFRTLLEINSISGKQVEIILKHKRIRSEMHDHQYFSYIENLLLNPLINFNIVKENTNILDLISNANYVIVMPFSSPAHIAGYLGIPSVYYDPTELLIEPSTLPPLGKFINNKAELTNYILMKMKIEK